MADAFDAYYEWLAIPPAEQPPNLYRLLGVQLFESKDNVIASAADRQMAHVRSFQIGTHAAASQKLLNELSNARLCLLDAAKKSAYDQKLKARLTPTSAVAKPVAVSASGIGRATGIKPLAMAKPLEAPTAPFADATIEEAAAADRKSAARRAAARARAAQQRTVGMAVTGAVLFAALIGIWWWQGRQPPVANNVASHLAPSPATQAGSSSDDMARSTGDESGSPFRIERSDERSTADSASSPALPEAPKLEIVDADKADDAAPIAPRIVRKPAKKIAKPVESDSADLDQLEAPAASQDAALPVPTPPRPAKAAAGKPAPPDAQAVADARALVNDLYKSEFAAAKKPAEKCELAQKLLKQAGESQAEPAAQYALWNAARDLAVEGGDVRVALAAIDAVASRYDLPKALRSPRSAAASQRRPDATPSSMRRRS